MKTRFFIIFLIILFMGNIVLISREYIVSVYDIPTSKYFVELFKAIDEITDDTFSIQLVPPGRGVYLMESDQTDIIFPATMSNVREKVSSVKFDYSTVKVYQMVFVLYINKNKPVDINALKKGNSKNYQIETTISLSNMFEFQPQHTTNIGNSLKKVEDGRIDGLLYAQDAADPLLKKMGYKNISRKLYSTNNIAFGIKKGTAGEELDKILTDSIKKLKKNGKLNQILKVCIDNSKFNKWQP